MQLLSRRGHPTIDARAPRKLVRLPPAGWKRGAMETQRPARIPEPQEFVPDDYFRRLEKAELIRAGRPLEIDLGCGDGKFLLEMAAHHPERDFLGVERLLGRVRKVCKRIGKLGLTNARVLRLESRYTAEWLLPPASVSRLHLLCPDPWPKLRHHRRRLAKSSASGCFTKAAAARSRWWWKRTARW